MNNQKINNAITLTYRGNTYQPSGSSLKIPKTKMSATYRGQSYQLSCPLEMSAQFAHDLVYRGVKYSKHLPSQPHLVTRNLQPILTKF